jgi:arylsulfatase A-like enzyme
MAVAFPDHPRSSTVSRRARLVGAAAAMVALGVVASGSPGSASAADAPAPSSSGTTDAPPVVPEPDVRPGGVGLEPALDALPDDRPNIVVIMTDDMREDELQWMPNVRRLVEDRGVRFVNSFSPYPLCCPARASFLTGQYTHNHEVWSNNVRYGFGALDDRSTVATDLTAAGYQTAFLGKYLNGYGIDSPRWHPGTDSRRYVPPGWTDWRGSANGIFAAGTPEAGGTYSYFDTTLNDNGTLRGNGGTYQTRMFGDETEDMLGGLTRSPRPFFLWASYVAPHAGGPIEPDDPEPVLRGNGRRFQLSTPARPKDVKGALDAQVSGPLGAVAERDLSDKPAFLRNSPTLNAAETEALTEVTRQRAESLWVVDQEVADTVEVLEELGELDDTVLVFTSDNGYFLGEHGMMETKRMAYESGLRVPTIISGPGFPEGEVRRDPFLTTDFAPTFLELAGARTSRTMDGVSMLDVARDGDRGWTRPVLTEAGPRNLKNGEKPAIERYPEGPSSLRFSQGLRTPRYLYVEHATDEQELYDLRTDPLQLTNLAGRADLRPVVADLARVLDGLRMCSGPSCAEPMPTSLQSP